MSPMMSHEEFARQRLKHKASDQDALAKNKGRQPTLQQIDGLSNKLRLILCLDGSMPFLRWLQVCDGKQFLLSSGFGERLFSCYAVDA